MPALTLSYPTFTSGTTIASAQVNANFNDIKSLLNTTKLDADNIQTGAITNSLLSGSITAAKLLATDPGKVLIGTTTTGVPTWTALSGDVTVTGGGVTAIGAGKVTNAMLAGSIAYSKLSLSDGDIPFAKLASLTSGKILVGDGSNIPVAVTPTGDATITDAGVFSVKGVTLSSASQTTGFTVSNTVERVSASGGAVTATLPTAVGIAGKEYTVVKTDTSANAVTVATTSSQTINGTTSYKLVLQYALVTVISDGANWVITRFRHTPYKFRAFYSSGSAFAINNTTPTVPFDSETYDYNGNFNTTTYEYTAPVAGTYEFRCTLRGTGTPAAFRAAYISLIKNGGEVARGLTPAIPSGGSYSSIFNDQIVLAAGDVVKVGAFSGVNDQLNGDSSGVLCYFSGELTPQ